MVLPSLVNACYDTYTTDDGQFSVSVDTPYLRNEGGGWACQDTNPSGALRCPPKA